LVTFILTVVVDLTVAIQVGIVLSALLFMKRMADAGGQISAEPDSDVIENYANIPKQIGVYEISGPFFFASAKHYSETMKSLGKKNKILIIRMRHVPFIDSTGMRNLTAVVVDMQHIGTKVILSGVQPSVRKDLDKNRLTFMVGKANVLDNFDAAIQRALVVLNEKGNEGKIA
jgi:sulfate permease, SulP family